MGLVIAPAIFDGRAPTAQEIARRVEELAGLPVKLEESAAELSSNLHDFRARLAFARYPAEKIKIHAYRRGAIKQNLERTGVADMPLAGVAQGTNEGPETQWVIVEGYIGQESTLFTVTCLALEKLGGRLPDGLAEEDRRQCARPISVAELERRHRKAFRKDLVLGTMGIFSFFIWLPFAMLWFAISAPSRARRARDVLERYRQKQQAAKSKS